MAPWIQLIIGLVIFTILYVGTVLAILGIVHKSMQSVGTKPEELSGFDKFFIKLIAGFPILNFLVLIYLLCLKDTWKLFKKTRLLIVFLFSPFLIQAQTPQDSININHAIRIYDLEENLEDLFIAHNIQSDIYDYQTSDVQITVNPFKIGVGLVHSYQRVIFSGEILYPNIDVSLVKLGLGMKLYDSYAYNYTVNSIITGTHFMQGDLPDHIPISLELGVTKQLINNYLVSFYYDLFNKDLKLGFGFKW